MMRITKLVASSALLIAGVAFATSPLAPIPDDAGCDCPATTGPASPGDGENLGGASHVVSHSISVTKIRDGNFSNAQNPGEGCPIQSQKCKWKVSATIQCGAGQTAKARLEAGGSIKSFNVLAPGGMNTGTLNNVVAGCQSTTSAVLKAKNPNEQNWTWLEGEILYCGGEI